MRCKSGSVRWKTYTKVRTKFLRSAELESKFSQKSAMPVAATQEGHMNTPAFRFTLSNGMAVA
jgi:hypothetical protein